MNDKAGNGELLMEIGTEEIPSGYIENAVGAFRDLTERSLKQEKIHVDGEISTYGTPRRLTLVIQGMAPRQEDTRQEITGPPKKAAFDAHGKPTKAAQGFAKKYDLSLDELAFRESPKGEYLFVQRTIPGRPTLEVLASIMPRWIEDIPWPKSMRWGDSNFIFVRPIHWLLALYEGRPVELEVGGIKSGDMTTGHRFMAPHRKSISSRLQYMEEMERSFVILDQKTREDLVKECVFEAAKTVSGIPDEDTSEPDPRSGPLPPRQTRRPAARTPARAPTEPPDRPLFAASCKSSKKCHVPTHCRQVPDCRNRPAVNRPIFRACAPA